MGVRSRTLLTSSAIALLCGITFELPRAEASESDPLGVRAIAYARVTEGYWQIWTYDLETGTQTQRTRSHSDKRDPVWRSDGSIAFRSHNNEVFSLPAGGGEAVPYRADLWPAFDPAGAPRDERIALAKMHQDVRDSTAIWIVGSKRGDQRVLTTGPGFWAHPDWSSDGKRLVYIRSFGYRGSEIRTIGLDDGAESVLLADPAHNIQPEWSPDDAAIAYASDRSGDYEIYVRAVPDGTDRRLTDRAGLDIRPTWSPDGSRIAYTSFREGKFEIWTMAADGNGAARLFASDFDASDPAWR
jgi:Tol biopolymer transport system component